MVLELSGVLSIPSSHVKAESKAIRGTISDYVLAWNQADIPAIDTLFDLSATYVSVLGILSSGRAEIADAHRWMLDGILGDRLLSIHEASLTIGLHKHATYRGRWELVPYPGERALIRPMAGMFLFTLHSVGGEWLVTSAQTTTYFPKPFSDYPLDLNHS